MSAKLRSTTPSIEPFRAGTQLSNGLTLTVCSASCPTSDAGRAAALKRHRAPGADPAVREQRQDDGGIGRCLHRHRACAGTGCQENRPVQSPTYLQPS